MSTIAANSNYGESPSGRPYTSRRIDRLVDALCLLGLGLSVLLLVASVGALGTFAYLRSTLALQPPIESPGENDTSVLEAAAPLLPCDATLGSALSVDFGSTGPQPCATPEAQGSLLVAMPSDGTPTTVSGMGTFQALVAVLERGPSSPPGGARRTIITYKVVAGDSLSSVAAAFGITPETVLWANDIKNPELLFAGQELKILPVSGVLHKVSSDDTVSSVAESYGADPKAVREANGLTEGTEPKEGQELVVPGGILRTTELMEGPPAPLPAAEVQTATRYKVKAGDSLGSIADSFGVLPSTIQAANDLMDPDKLSIGQELAIPGARVTSAQGGQGEASTKPVAAPAQSVPPTAAPTSPPVPQAPVSAAASGAQYTVKSGDTLFSIAKAYGVKPQSIQDANGLADPGKLKLGQTLLIPGVAANAQAAVQVATSTAVPQPPTATPVPPKPAVAQPAPKPASQPAVPAGGSLGDRVAAIAQKYVGYRYIWGGHSPDGFDCSGFTWYVYREAGYNIPLHDLNGQLNLGQKVTLDKLAPGDMVFFQNTYKQGLSHAGIYLGGGRFINAESEKVGVQVRSISDPFWASRFVGASRPR
ncbi:MAG TPA: LysM peptidoglycan-binding domain-containing protein [Chloroflexota bacterium]|nr:LysM peptidoglycan-binding domain-containing protein [Chloroflexota bacterium]